MSQLRKQVHMKNMKNKIYTHLINTIVDEIEDMNFDILLNYYCEYKIKFDIDIRDFKYYICDIIFPKSLQYNIIDSHIINIIKNLLNHFFGYNNVNLMYFFTTFQQSIIVSFYIIFDDIDDLHFLIVS
jgi:hypothetical protein